MWTPLINLMQGDCLELMRRIPDKSVDMILCDLPYGTTQNKWDAVIPLDALWKQYERVITDHGIIVLFAAGMFTADLMQSNRKLWRYNLVWHKTQPSGFLNARKMPMRAHEDLCVFYKKLPVYHPQKTSGHPRKTSTAEQKMRCKQSVSTNYGDYGLVSYDSTERYPTSILTFAKDIQKAALHPTQKPVALCEWLIKTYTDEGATVLDNCMGSGTTGVACAHTGRKFIGMELEQEMFQTAMNRIFSEFYASKAADRESDATIEIPEVEGNAS